jgi:hypothetical protein
MAKFTITGDTDNHSLSVTINGQVIDNIRYASVSDYSFEDESPFISLNVELQTEEKDGVRKYTSIVAADSDAAKDAPVKNAIAGIEDFVEIPSQNGVMETLRSIFSEKN